MKFVGPNTYYRNVPRPVLIAVVTIIARGAPIATRTLLSKVRALLARRDIELSSETFNAALQYLVKQHAIRITNGRITKAQGWSGSPLVLWSQTKFPGDVSASRKVGRKAVARKKAVGKGPRGRRQLRRPANQHVSVQKPVAVECERHVVKVFYATDRESVDDGYSSNGVPSKSLQRGIATVSFPKRRNMGDTNEPPMNLQILATLFPKKYSTIDSIKRTNKSGFHSALKSAMGKSTQSLFVFVHGFACSFDSAVKRAAQIKLDTKFQGEAVVYSWPSRGSFAFYDIDGDRISHAADVLVNFLDELQEKHAEAAIHVVGHSMGGHIVALALERRDPAKSVSEIVLQAPDISSLDYGRFATALASKSRRVTVYANALDAALASSKIKRLAKGVYRIGQNVKHAIHHLVDAIDATRFGKDGLFGHGYVFKRALTTDLRETLEGMNQTRPQLIERSAAGMRYFEFQK